MSSLDLSSVTDTKIIEKSFALAANLGVKLYINGVEVTYSASIKIAPWPDVVKRAQEKDCSIYWKTEYPLWMIAPKKGNNNKVGGGSKVAPASFDIGSVVEQLRKYLEVYGCNTSPVSPMHWVDVNSIRVNAQQISFETMPPSGKRETFYIEVKKGTSSPTK